MPRAWSHERPTVKRSGLTDRLDASPARVTSRTQGPNYQTTHQDGASVRRSPRERDRLPEKTQYGMMSLLVAAIGDHHNDG